MRNLSRTDSKLIIELIIVLLVKLLLLFFIWQSFFSTAPEAITAHQMADTLLNSNAPGGTP